MIRVLMIDLGETLIHNNEVFPHVYEALETLSKFEASKGKPLEICLVSDFDMPASPAKSKVEAIFREYVSLLDQVGLKKFFEPVKKRVTLSTHAGVSKPDRRIFEVALERMGLSADLNECLFITENAEHIAACRKYGMKTLRFDASGSPTADFSDWAEAPLLVARAATPKNAHNLELALKTYLSLEHGLDLVMMESEAGGRFYGRAKKLFPVAGRTRSAEQKIHVSLPVQVAVELDEKGRIKSVDSTQPDEDEIEEAAHYVRTLEKH